MKKFEKNVSWIYSNDTFIKRFFVFFVIRRSGGTFL